ncbi:hypothetical protein LSTR_LSTR007822 [Laodelphax striatellus]|uniref:Cation-dependent mannose-6-phosphate receptor n=1 Tax=Laodelphax striatellus TaxID=195883 RepID=A0A482WP18_LAOST|nr:hypothetical protein LSTR_LSTR007822 [Laodelphax striatellus]
MFENYLFQVIFVLFIVFSVNILETNSLKGKNGKCVQTNACKCTFPDGMYYDLSLLRAVQFGWLKLNDTEGTELSYTPCKDTLVIDPSGSNDCNLGSGVSLCLRRNSTIGKYTGFTLSTSEFVSINENEPTSLKFEKIVESKSTLVTIRLMCDKSAPMPDLKVLPNSKPPEFALLLTSAEACLKGTSSLDDDEAMSTGSKLIIIFLVLFSAYFGGGVLALKYIRGAEGFEMIPNYEFWSDLPYLVRDGVLFLVSGFQITPSYDRI